MTVDVLRIRADAARRGYMTEDDIRQIAAYRSVPAPAEDVPPSLRSLQSPAAMADAERFGEEMRRLSLWMADPVSFVERVIVSRMGERWPLVAAADNALGGLISEVVRKAGRTGGDLPGWVYAASGLAIGHPQDVDGVCRELLARPERRRASYREEAPDAHIMRASGNHADKDLSDDDHLSEAADDCPF